MIGQMVKQDAGLDDDEARLLSVGMVAWPRSPRGTGSPLRDHIRGRPLSQLVARLAWRGISGWPAASGETPHGSQDRDPVRAA